MTEYARRELLERLGIGTAGLLLGGACWWACLSWLVSQLRSKMTEKRLERINQIAGVILGLCGAGLVLKALWAIGQSSAAVA